MKIYEPDQEVVVTLGFVSPEGDTIDPTQIDYQIVDETGAEVKALANIALPAAGTGQVAITVDVAENSIGTEVRGMRKVELKVTNGTDFFWVRDSYILELASSLVFSTNSFQTYDEALLVSRGLAGMAGWDKANDQHRTSALQQAFDLLGSFSYRIMFEEGDSQTYFEGSISELTADQWAILDPTWVANFQKAQILQANFLLGGVKIEKNIADGLQSSSIGEVSQFYRPRASLVLPICRDAVKYVGRYIKWSVGLGRA